MISKNIDFETEYGAEIIDGLLVFNSASIFTQKVDRDGVQVTEYSIEMTAALYYSKENMEAGKSPIQMLTKISGFDMASDLASTFERVFP